MPRKKSAAKRDKEKDLFAENRIQDELFSREGREKVTEALISQEFAKRLEYEKREALQDDLSDESSESTSEEEDEVGELNNPQIDAAILSVIAKIRNKDPAVYNAQGKFFDDIESSAPKEKAVKPVRIADMQREALLSGRANDDSDEEDMTHVQEQSALKDAFKGIDEADSDEDILVPRKRTETEQREEEDAYEAFLKQQLENGVSEQIFNTTEAENPEGEKFLMDYVMKRGWVDKTADRVPSYDQIVVPDQELEEFEEQAETFETTYNFRFEQPGATEITAHPRDVQSVRRKDDKRKKEKEAKQAKEEAAKQKRLEEIKRQRNLKKTEYEKKIEEIEKATGQPMNFDDLDLDGEFDPEDWDKKMLARFDEKFYEHDDDLKPEWDDEEIDIDEEPDEEPDEAPVKKPTKKEERIKKRKIEAMVDAAVPEPLGPDGRMFRYRKVAPETFGLSIEDILFADDKKLNEYVGLKKLAAYKPAEYQEADRKRLGSKKRAKRFQQELWSQSKWSEGRE